LCFCRFFEVFIGRDLQVRRRDAILLAVILWTAAAAAGSPGRAIAGLLAWKSQAPLRVRLGTVILAAALVNPHVIIYDLTVLALHLLWFGAPMQGPGM
jgi:hypothetical protein